jgi:uncharacterized protein YndB with AHSA1/START domain
MQKEIKHEWFYSQPAGQVWDYLTKPELMEQWLMKTDFQPVAGHEFNFWTKPLPNFGFDGIIYCKVLEIIPFKKLSYSWKGGPGNGAFTLDSVVVWTLTPKDNGTQLLLQHSGFREDDYMMFSVMGEGWLRNIGKIGELLNARKNDEATS